MYLQIIIIFLKKTLIVAMDPSYKEKGLVLQRKMLSLVFRFYCWGDSTSSAGAPPTLPPSAPNYFPSGGSFASPLPGAPWRCVCVNPVGAEGPPADHLQVGLLPWVLGLCEIGNYILVISVSPNYHAKGWINTSLKTH